MRESFAEEEEEKVSVSIRNRTRLILQNRKLLGEVFKLEQMINAVIERSAAEQWTGIEQSEELQQKYRSEQEEQLRTIKHLKQQIKAAKASQGQNKYDEVRNEENQLTFLRRECKKLEQERDTLAQQKREKDNALEYHQPINAQTASTLQQYKKTRIANGELKAKLHQLDREVTKYHHLKEIAKTSVPPQIDNPEYQIIKMDTEITNMRKEMKRIDEKWRSKIEAIDREYFAFKDIRQGKFQQTEALEKELRNYENHVAAMRDEVAVANDRERINSVPISPQKRRQMQELLQQQKKRLKRLSPKAADRIKYHQPNKTVTQKLPKQEGELKLIIQAKEETNSEKPLPTPPKSSQSQNTDKKEKSISSEMREVRAKKLVESVGVGTSFYYAED